MNSGRTVDLGGGRCAHASGALWLPDLRTVLVADVHLGFGWAMRRRGQLGPVTDDGTEAKLLGMLAELQPATVVFLGDLVHAARPAPAERAGIARMLTGIEAHVVVVLGNHDRGFTRDFPEFAQIVCSEWEAPGFIAVHGDQPLPATPHVVAGHLHPAFTVFDDAGSGRKMPAFVVGERLTLLPAFSAMATGFDVRCGLPEEAGPDPRIVVASGRRAVDLGVLSRLRGQFRD